MKIHVGDKFKLTPTARTVYLAIQVMDYGEVKATRVDSEFGKRATAWLDAGKPDGAERRALSRDFGYSNPEAFQESKLATAVVL